MIIDKLIKFLSGFASREAGRMEIVKGQTKLPDASSAKANISQGFRVFKWALFFAALVLLLAVHNYIPKTLPKLDEAARFDIVAPYSLKIIDEKKTDDVRNELVRSVPNKYKHDKAIAANASKNVEAVFDAIKAARADNQKAKLPPEEIEKRIASIPVSFNSFKNALAMPDETIDRARRGLSRLIDNIMSAEIPVEKVHDVRNGALLKIKTMPFDEDVQKLLSDIVESSINANYIYDKEATQKQRDKLVAGAVPVEKHFKEGEIIVRHGEIINRDHIKMFEKFNFYESHQRPSLAILSAALISFFSVVVIIIYLIQNKSEIFKQEGLLTMMAIIVMSILVIAKIVAYLTAGSNSLSPLSPTEASFFSPYVVPIPAAAILVALLIDTKLAFILNIIVVIFVEMILGHNSLNYVVINIMSGIVAILNVKNVNHRTDLTKAGIMVSFSNVFLIMAYAFLDYDSINTSYRSNVMRDAVWGFFNGFISAIFAIGMLPYLESIFKVSTSMRLLELSDLNQPLLRRLLLEAPGTYHHSMIVGNLAEAAAKDIGADALLCRVGAYYHDIGKLKRPMFFIENQNCGQNIHDSIKPNLSAKAIMSHTKDGYEIGLENQLPLEILEVIVQHHGTNLITYFYSKAMNNVDPAAKDEQFEEEYRYAGPKPQTRETAIILLADAIEAASRTLAKPSVAAIDSLVKRIKNERFNDGQFDECNITLKDLEKISSTFVRIIAGMHHSRIEYPAEPDRSKGRQASAPVVSPQPQAAPEQSGAACPPQACETAAAVMEGSPVIENKEQQ